MSDGATNQTDSRHEHAEQDFLKLVRQRELVPAVLLDSVLNLHEEAQELGVSKPLAEILVSKGVLAREEVDELLREVAGKRGDFPDVDGFELYEKIGEGGMGTVYRARQLSMDRDVAVKMMSDRLSRNQSYIERFYREARACARLNHPHIVQGIDVGQCHGRYYFAMEFVNGPTVKELIVREGRLNVKQTLQVMREICEALQHAWDHGQVHRDVKPDNIMIDGSGGAKLCDLGLAKTIEREQKAEAEITRHGTAVGTPHYISPEQARGREDLDVRADIYSLGATAYHMITGLTPFEGSSGVVVAKHLTSQCASAWCYNPEMPPDLAYVLERMMAKDPKDRYHEPKDVIGELERIRHHRPVHAREFRKESTCLALERNPERFQSRRLGGLTPLQAGAVGLLLIILAVLLGILIGRGPIEQPVVPTLQDDAAVILDYLHDKNSEKALREIYYNLSYAEQMEQRRPGFARRNATAMKDLYQLDDHELQLVRAVGDRLGWPRGAVEPEQPPTNSPEDTQQPSDTVASERLQKARERFNQARELIEQHGYVGDHAEEVGRHLRYVWVVSGADSELGLRANALLKKLQQAGEADRKRIVEQVETAVGRLAQRNAFGEARQVLEQALANNEDPWVVNKLKQRQQSLAKAAVAWVNRVADEVLSAEEYDAAAHAHLQQQLQQTEAWGLQPVNELREDILAELAKRKEQAQENARAEDHRRFRSELEEARLMATKKRDIPGALTQLRRLQANPRYATWKSQAQNLHADLQRTQALLQAVRANLPHLVGERLQLEGIQEPHNFHGSVTAVTDNSITLRSGDGSLTRQLQSLTVGDWYTLAAQGHTDRATLDRLRLQAASAGIIYGYEDVNQFLNPISTPALLPQKDALLARVQAAD